MEKIVAIVAAHNEEDAIRNTLNILKDFKKKGIIHEILVVNDGSTDETLKEARFFGAKVVSHQKQSGKRKVFSTGIKEAHRMGATSVLMLDADIVEFPEATARKMLKEVSDPKRCLMATAQQLEPASPGTIEEAIHDINSNAQRALNMQAVEPLLRGNKKWIDILEKKTNKKWGLEYALERLIPPNKKVFLSDYTVSTRIAFRDAHKYKVERRKGIKNDLFLQQKMDRNYIDEVYAKRRRLAHVKNWYRTSFARRLIRMRK